MDRDFGKRRIDRVEIDSLKKTDSSCRKSLIEWQDLFFNEVLYDLLFSLDFSSFLQD